MKPKDVTALRMAFPANLEDLMPKYSEIPDDFKRHDGTKWHKLFTDCFFFGLTDLRLIPKEGIDPQQAWRHIRCIMGSFEPKHEHKEAACAFLMNEWFADATWTRAGKADHANDIAKSGGV